MLFSLAEIMEGGGADVTNAPFRSIWPMIFFILHISSKVTENKLILNDPVRLSVDVNGMCLNGIRNKHRLLNRLSKGFYLTYSETIHGDDRDCQYKPILTISDKEILYRLLSHYGFSAIYERYLGKYANVIEMNGITEFVSVY